MDDLAIVWSDKGKDEKSYSYRDLDVLSSRAAKLLQSRGVKKGDRVCLYIKSSPETYIFVLAILKCGAIYCPLFPSFGPEAIQYRFKDCQASLIVTEADMAENVKGFPSIVIDRDKFLKELSALASDFIPSLVKADDSAIIHYTSGTTGKAKGALHCHRAVVRHYETCKNVLGLSRGVSYWCTADPAWVTGTSYGVFAPLAAGARTLVCEPSNRAGQILNTLEKYKVSVWYTAPTLLRMMMREKKLDFSSFDLSSLQRIFSVGEALNPEVSEWVYSRLGLDVFDTWFQTETGSIMIANDGSFPIRPGSMGKALGDVEIGILDDNYDLVSANKKGHLAIRSPWSSMFCNYWGREDLYKSSFKGDWYISGDLAYKDDDGYFYFVSREDDVINTAGHLLSPIEVENVLARHESIKEVAVSGVEDRLLGQAVKAKIVLKEGFEPSLDLQIEYKMLARHKLSPFASPQIIEFVASIPKTESGKTIR